MQSKKDGPKILVLDIETAPLLAHVWRLYDENIGLDQIKKDWHLLAWAAKWYDLNDSTVMYMDQRHEKNIEDDKKICKEIRNLMDEADIIITQNGKQFDAKRLNSRFIINKIERPSSYKHYDTCEIARNVFGFTSNKLQYLTSKLNTKYKKLSHAKYPGFELWKACLEGDKDAWKEMEKYNKHDVLSTEELFSHVAPWSSHINLDAYYGDNKNHCICGSTNFKRYGFVFTSTGKYQRYKCLDCGSEAKDRSNQFDKIKRQSIKLKVGA